MIRRAWRWLFVSRWDGRVSIVAWPNAPLWVWIATVVLRVPPLPGGVESALGLLGTLALLVWALWELLGGVNPFRRLLGLVVLVGTVHGVVR